MHVPTSNLKGSRYELPSMYPVHRTLLTVTGLYKGPCKHCRIRCSRHTEPRLYHVQVAAECCRASCAISSESAPAVRQSHPCPSPRPGGPLGRRPLLTRSRLTRRNICPRSHRSPAPPDSPDQRPHQSRRSRASPAGVQTRLPRLNPMWHEGGNGVLK